MGAEGAAMQHVKPGTESITENRANPIKFKPCVIDAGRPGDRTAPHVLRR